MVKRPKTPEFVDEATYFAIYQPYPLNVNWELEGDYIVFCRWIAGCLGGPNALFSFHHKPRARGMVIIEVDKAYGQPQRLLGEHRWSEFLKRPSAEESGRISQVYYSIYSTARAVGKDGWKRVDVEDSWFKGWSLSNSVIHNPYPATHWCDLPAEDPTNKNICRPLPKAIQQEKPAPPPAKKPPPVVGSSIWVDAKGAPSKDTPQAKRSAWGKGKVTPSVVVPKPAPKKASPITTNAWKKPITEKVTSPLSASSTSSRTGGSSPASAVSPGAPPGLPSPYIVPPGLVRDDGFSRTDAPPNRPGASEYTQILDEFVGIPRSANPNVTLYGLEYLDEDDDVEAIDPWVRTDIVDPVPPAAPPTVAEPTARETAEEQTAKEPAEKEQETVPAPIVILCPVHGVICKKKICRTYTKLYREAERKQKQELKEAEKEEQAKQKKAERKERKKKAREEKNAGDWVGTEHLAPTVSETNGSALSDTASNNSNEGDDKSSSAAPSVPMSKRWADYDDDDSSTTGSLGEVWAGPRRGRANSLESRAETIASVSVGVWD
ncbi:hypothetical protein BD779DRAFT_1647774 [Infundibulicybe gibba]|nr:hypothetical protein BD779DRAFT_1647774 [Infundibulicybe gibba]